jgi:hypothetical protein
MHPDFAPPEFRSFADRFHRRGCRLLSAVNSCRIWSIVLPCCRWTMNLLTSAVGPHAFRRRKAADAFPSATSDFLCCADWRTNHFSCLRQAHRSKLGRSSVLPGHLGPCRRASGSATTPRPIPPRNCYASLQISVCDSTVRRIFSSAANGLCEREIGDVDEKWACLYRHGSCLSFAARQLLSLGFSSSDRKVSFWPERSDPAQVGQVQAKRSRLRRSKVLKKISRCH